MAATTTQLGLVTPTQGDLTGTWGNVVNNGITEYTNIAIAGTTTFDGDGAVTLANTTGNASNTNIASTSAQYAVVRVTGTLTPGTPKVITFGSAGSPAYSKLYMVDNASTGVVSFVPYGGSGVSIAANESCFVYYNGTNIIKLTSDTALGGYTSTATAAGTTTLTAASTGTQFFTGTTTQTVVLPVTSTLILGQTFTIHNNSTGDVTVTSSGSNTVAVVTANTTVTLTCILTSGTTAASWDADFTGFTTALSPARGGTGVVNNAASTLTISGNFPTTLTVGASTSVTLPPSGSLGYLNIPLSGAAKTSSYTLAVGDIGELIQVNTGGSIVVPDNIFATGDAVVIFNNTSGAITLTMSITTAYIGGTDADKATISLATRGICNVLFISGTVCVVTGNVT